MKAECPRGLDQEEYIQEISSKYQALYPQFSQKHVDVMVKEVVELIFASIDYEKESNLLQRHYVEQLVSFVEDEEVKIKITDLSTIKDLYFFQRRFEEPIMDFLEEKKLSLLAENKEEFLNFISKMTSECILNIADTSIAITSFEEKKKYEDFLESLEQKENEPTASSSFTERVGGSKRGREETAEVKKEKSHTSFAEQVRVREFKVIEGERTRAPESRGKRSATIAANLAPVGGAQRK